MKCAGCGLFDVVPPSLYCKNCEDDTGEIVRIYRNARRMAKRSAIGHSSHGVLRRSVKKASAAKKASRTSKQLTSVKKKGATKKARKSAGAKASKARRPTRRSR